MSQDRFEEAVRSLRDEGAPGSEDVRRVRRRVLESLARPEVRRRRTSPWLVLLAATFVATSALAATGSFSWLARALRGPAEAPSPPAVLAPGEKPKASAGGSYPEAAKGTDVNAAATAPEPREQAPAAMPERDTPVVATAVPVGAEAAAKPTASVGERAPSLEAPAVVKAAADAPASSSLSSAAAPVAAAGQADDAERRELAKYRAAHTLHFASKDYAAALTAWHAYLAAHPAGVLVHEARYNRAICLLELGRAGEAAKALAPFADGAVSGGYRKAEARALLSAMDAGR